MVNREKPAAERNELLAVSEGIVDKSTIFEYTPHAPSVGLFGRLHGLRGWTTATRVWAAKDSFWEEESPGGPGSGSLADDGQ